MAEVTHVCPDCGFEFHYVVHPIRFHTCPKCKTKFEEPPRAEPTIVQLRRSGVLVQMPDENHRRVILKFDTGAEAIDLGSKLVAAGHKLTAIELELERKEREREGSDG